MRSIEPVTVCNGLRQPPLRTFRVIACIRRIKRILGTWRRVSDLLGYSPAYWAMIAKGERQPNLEAENILRYWAGHPPKHRARITELEPWELSDYMRNRQPVQYTHQPARR